MCELCTFSQIRSHMIMIKIHTVILLYNITIIINLISYMQYYDVSCACINVILPNDNCSSCGLEDIIMVVQHILNNYTKPGDS